MIAGNQESVRNSASYLPVIAIITICLQQFQSTPRAHSSLLFSQERLIELEPPGGLRTLDEGRSVRTFPQFMLDPFANELFDTLVLLSSELDGIFERESRKQITLIFSNSSFDNSPSFSFLLVFQLRLMELLPPGACKTREDVLPSFTK